MRTETEQCLGASRAFLNVLDQVSRVAPLNRPVLVVGERGSGKELIAERLHFLSERWDSPFLKVNCAALSESLLESELFGHEAGAFTGANRTHKGRFERADQGTLFLDELASTSSAVQEKLLRIIEYGEFERLGADSVRKVNVRVVAATNVDLPELARQKKFRADLLDRLAFDVITLPPLREREDDVLLLAEHFALSMSVELGRSLFPGSRRPPRSNCLTMHGLEISASSRTLPNARCIEPTPRSRFPNSCSTHLSRPTDPAKRFPALARRDIGFPWIFASTWETKSRRSLRPRSKRRDSISAAPRACSASPTINCADS